ncbi:hypothetical protein QW180_00785 [Vibrio sinaloensis]|nr:hypothetical protein [Vibrio sinaloensis]
MLFKEPLAAAGLKRELPALNERVYGVLAGHDFFSQYIYKLHPEAKNKGIQRF